MQNKSKPSQLIIKPKQPTTGTSAESNKQNGSKVKTAILQYLQSLQPPVTQSEPLTQTACDPKPLSMSDSKVTPMMTRQLSVSGMSSNVITYKRYKIEM